jgi:hypothetical protein
LAPFFFLFIIPFSPPVLFLVLLSHFQPPSIFFYVHFFLSSSFCVFLPVSLSFCLYFVKNLILPFSSIDLILPAALQPLDRLSL